MIPNAPTIANITIQLASGVRLPLVMPFTTLSPTRIEPPLPRIFSITPSQNSRPARVTMNEGRPIRVIKVPWRRPISAQTPSAATIAAHHGQFKPDGFNASASTTPPSPATNPIDRSISPSSSA